MAAEFIGESIDVATRGEPREPVSFVWRDETHVISEILHAWSDWGFNPATKHRNWRSRRHRNYYRIRTEGGPVYEMYLDRGIKPGREAWILYQQLEEDGSASS